jgi:hypothetical protein
MSSAIATASEHGQDFAKTSRALISLFTATVFWASALLFVLEPMFAKMILPLFGGSPAVWNTSMVFFQSALFLAYIYSHYVAQRKSAQSVLIHSVAILAPLLVLPISIRAASNLNMVVNHPTAAVLMIAVSSIGLPFFFVATTAPLVQRWFSRTSHRDASDPYFLYAASNAGSLIGLALYPCILEPQFRVGQQSMIWFIGYIIFAVLTVACGVAGYRWRTPDPLPITSDTGADPQQTDRLLWAALAFVPASLLYAFTAQLSVDFPPVPLLWVIPLGLYLLTFIVAFSTPFECLRHAGRVLPSIIVAAMIVFLLGFNTRYGWWGVLGVMKLCCFVLVALAFHTELAQRRPARQHLTEYYLWVSAGGILGGLLNSFVAPVVFSDFWEYPLTLIVAAALLPTISVVSRRPINLKIIGAALAVTSIVGIAMRMSSSPSSSAIRVAALFAGAILCMRVPVKWTAAALLLVSLSIGWVYPLHPLFQRRSFFGRYQVTTAEEGKWHILLHGTTIHGLQRMVDSPLHRTPTGYYLPVKTAFDLALSNKPSANIAVVGLGAGIIACYSSPEQSTTFFEIDPLVERIASRYFTFLSQCAGHKNVILGDARLTLANAAPHSFDVIVLDAFSSDAIPVHLLTKEAFRLYREKLTADGLLLVHISNLYLDIAPVVADSGAQAGYSILLLDDTRVTPAEAAEGRHPSRWAVVLPSDLEREFEAHGWKPFTDPGLEWTDNHSSIFSVMKWQNLVGSESFRGWIRGRK